MTTARRARTAAISGLLMAAGGLTAAAATPASAAPAPASVSPCVRPSGSLAFRGGHGLDPNVMVPARARAVQRLIERRSTQRLGSVLPAVVTIPVHAHIIKGTHRGDKFIYPKGVANTITVLNTSYAGKQKWHSAKTRYVFQLATTTTTVNDSWYHLNDPMKAVDREMKATLHEGDQSSLNLYFLRPEPDRFGQLLGWSSFPWDYQRDPTQDGVVINLDTLPGGAATHYKLGDTGTHEVGHWLGLYHVFSDYGRCRNDDFVSDTPIQKTPSNGCPTRKNSCRSNWGKDSVHNFMDYSYDSCMYEFTRGQVQRMDQSWQSFRTPAPAPAV